MFRINPIFCLSLKYSSAEYFTNIHQVKTKSLSISSLVIGMTVTVSFLDLSLVSATSRMPNQRTLKSSVSKRPGI